MRFWINARRIRFAARSLKYVRMYSIRRRAAVNGLLSKNLRPQRRKIIRFCKAAGRRNTGRISRTTTQQNRTIHTLGGALYFDCIVYALERII